jgi:hypothetical protein
LYPQELDRNRYAHGINASEKLTVVRQHFKTGTIDYPQGIQARPRKRQLAKG